jgi:hypothetical protein
MAETENTYETETPVEESAPRAADSIEQPKVAVPANALVGDDAKLDPREADVDVNKDSVPAQTTGAPAVEVDTVYVHETSVQLDEVITDPHSPLAVQVPDEGRGFLNLPIHGLDAPRPEDVFDAARKDES